MAPKILTTLVLHALYEPLSWSMDGTCDYDGKWLDFTPIIGSLISRLGVSQMEIILGRPDLSNVACIREWSFRGVSPCWPRSKQMATLWTVSGSHAARNYGWPLGGGCSLWMVASKKRGVSVMQPQGNHLYQQPGACMTQRLRWESQPH